MNKCTVSVLKTGLAGMAAAAVFFGAWPQAEAAVITAPPEARQHKELQGQRLPGGVPLQVGAALGAGVFADGCG